MDEDQKAVCKNNFKFKTFKFAKGDKEDEKRAKAECTEFQQKIMQERGQRWSDVNHTDSAYFVAYSRIGELTALALEEAGRHFELLAEITGNFIVGRSWEECH